MNVTSTRERYHFAKLALFNVRLLHTINESEHAEIRALLASQAEANGFSDVPNLLNQGTFLQFSYICLVWLWESAKQSGHEGALLAQYPEAAHHQQLDFPNSSAVNGERVLNDWRSVLRLLRNALSHGKVEVSDDSFVFVDQNTHGKNPEQAPTRLTLSWTQLGGISEACIHALTPSLWPKAG